MSELMPILEQDTRINYKNNDIVIGFRVSVDEETYMLYIGTASKNTPTSFDANWVYNFDADIFRRAYDNDDVANELNVRAIKPINDYIEKTYGRFEEGKAPWHEGVAVFFRDNSVFNPTTGFSI